MPILEGMDEALARAARPIRPGRSLPRRGRRIWIQLPLAEAQRLSPSSAMPAYCEARRCQSKQRTATTIHALISGQGKANVVWMACADCTGLMIEGAYAT